jgi:hypothetical protein
MIATPILFEVMAAAQFSTLQELLVAVDSRAKASK